MKKYQHTQGFTLLELTVVLLIIVAVTSGVLVARSVLMTSRLQTVITDAGNFMSAFGNFKQAYYGLPGDYADATSKWGTDSSGCNSGGGISGTCNGNGDGKVGGACVSGSHSTSTDYEIFRVWQHLNSAGLYKNTLSGVTTSGTAYTKAGVNVPASSIEGAGFTFMWLDDASQCSNFHGLMTTTGGAPYGNALVLARTISITSAPSITITPVLTPEQASGIDAKMDDGIPGTGTVRSFGAGTTGCTTTNDSATGAYALTASTAKCAPIFITGY